MHPRSFAGLASIAASLLLVACGGGGGSTGGGTPAAPFGIAARPSLAPLAFPSGAVQSGDVAVQRVFPNLTFTNPLAFAVAPGDRSRGYVASQQGVIRVFALDDPNATLAPVFLDIDARVTNEGGETGLLGLAFDPDYATNGWFYLNYLPNSTFDGSGNPGRRTRISRFTVTADRNVADPASEQVLLEFSQPFANHNGGWLGFGPDRKLYVATGDGGSSGDPQGNGQRLDTLLGKLLRLNPDGSAAADNPFVAQSGARAEIWAYGLRNPFRASFDRATGALWAGDVGQNQYEEVDVLTRGGNYGWNQREGLHGYPTASAPKPPSTPSGNSFIDPVLEYDHGAGCSITGGAVYRGGAIPALAGRYVYSDFCSGTLWAASPVDGSPATATVIGSLPGNPSSFGEDADGELYVTGLSTGALYKLVPGSGGAGETLPTQLSATGLFSDTAALRPNPGLIPYQPNAPFWSDGSDKRRWFGVPNGTRIMFSANGAWRFPVGTVTVKQFDIRLASGAARRLETRVFVNQSNGWQGYTYRWNEAGSDAVLLETAASETLVTAAGSQTYEYPSRAACLSCHTAASGYVLGIGTAQINGLYAYAAASDNQLRTLNHIGLFTSDIGTASQYPVRTDPADASQPLTARARAYLDTNCAQCHQPGGPAPVNIDLRAATPIASTNLVGVLPQNGALGLADARRISAGSKEASVLWERLRRLDASRMPPLASHVVDEAGVALIGQWIDAGAQ